MRASWYADLFYTIYSYLFCYLKKRQGIIGQIEDFKVLQRYFEPLGLKPPALLDKEFFCFPKKNVEQFLNFSS